MKNQVLFGSVLVQVLPTNLRKSKCKSESNFSFLCTRQKRKVASAIDEMFSQTIQVKMNEKTLEYACLELVTINGHHFKLKDDSEFRKILNPLLEGMQAKFTINAENIHKKIGEKANDAHNRTKLEVEGKLVSSKS